jgi:fibronectin-binding autotransporter adhesin
VGSGITDVTLEAGGLGLTKAGAGSLILESDAAYDGPTTVAAGTVGRPGRLTVQEGGSWTQGDGLVVGGQGGFNAWLEVPVGGTLAYTGTAAVLLNGSEGYGDRAYRSSAAPSPSTSSAPRPTTS